MRHHTPNVRGITLGILALAGLAGLVGSGPAAAQQLDTLRVSSETIAGQCKIGEGGPVLYRSVGAHHDCALYAAPLGSIFMVVDETGEGVDIALANRGAKLNAPEPRVATCGRGSMVILTVIAETTESDGFTRAVYNAGCVAGPFARPVS
jgi:hypothetical protein